MKYFDVTYKVAKQYEIILKDKQLRQIKAWYETKKGDGTISAESEEVLKEILNKEKTHAAVIAQGTLITKQKTKIDRENEKKEKEKEKEKERGGGR